MLFAQLAAIRNKSIGTEVPPTKKGRFRGPFSGCGTRRAYFFSPASLRRSSALSVFSHEKAVAVCFLPAPST
ncbi:DUF6053 domain-containing protein [Lysobacter enzymogenes]|uniref:DUF6053 domain-containing protein n=1 Tax=Lysobacter enzymogenes TaxID=69 RepID=UPI003D18C56B